MNTNNKKDIRKIIFKKKETLYKIIRKKSENFIKFNMEQYIKNDMLSTMHELCKYMDYTSNTSVLLKVRLLIP